MQMAVAEMETGRMWLIGDGRSCRPGVGDNVRNCFRIIVMTGMMKRNKTRDSGGGVCCLRELDALQDGTIIASHAGAFAEGDVDAVSSIQSSI